MNYTDRDEYDEALPTPKYVRGLKRIITEQNIIIRGFIEGYSMREHIGRVDSSSQTEAAPAVLFYMPTPPKEGAPRKSTRYHRRNKTYPQEARSSDICHEKVVSSPPSNAQEDGHLPRWQKRSRRLHEDVQRLTLNEGHRHPYTAQPSMQTLPPIPLTEAPSFHTGSVDMTTL
ncbi:hypothetical protein ACROYT_G023462 [Oculina patagonica]